jgi:hypothetical protein
MLRLLPLGLLGDDRRSLVFSLTQGSSWSMSSCLRTYTDEGAHASRATKAMRMAARLPGC